MQYKLTIEEICTTLEIPINTYGLVDRVSMEEAQKNLSDFKKLAKAQQRKLAKLYHPDLPTTGKEEEEKMKKINAVVDAVNSLKVQKLEPVPRPFTIRVFRTGGPVWGSTSTSTSTSTNTWGY